MSRNRVRCSEPALSLAPRTAAMASWAAWPAAVSCQRARRRRKSSSRATRAVSWVQVTLPHSSSWRSWASSPSVGSPEAASPAATWSVRSSIS